MWFGHKLGFYLMRFFLRSLSLVAVVGLLSLSTASAQKLFTGNAAGNNNWFDGANWAPAGVPNGTSGTVFVNFGTLNFDPLVVDESITSATAEAPELVISELSNQTNYLNIQSNLSTTGGFQTGAGVGEIIQTGGTVNVGTNLLLGDSSSGSGFGLYRLSGASSRVEVGGNVQINGVDSSSVFFQEGGLLDVTGNLSIGSQVDTTGTFRLSGDARLSVDGTLSVGSTSTARTAGNGTLIIDGATTSGFLLAQDFELNNSTALGDPPPSVLEVQIDALAAADPSGLLLMNIVGDVLFDDGTYLMPVFNGTAPVDGSWTVMTWDGSVTDLGLELHPDTEAGWAFTVGEFGNELVITYTVPEPSSASILLLAALGLAWRQRRV